VDEFVRDAYRLVLGRAPDAEALAWARSLSRAELIAELVASEEFAHLRALEEAVALAARARSVGVRPRELHAPPGTDERLVEIPWVLARYRGEPRVLDVGYANAPPAYLEALIGAAPADVVGLDPVEARVDGIRSVVGDLRAPPFADGSFDVVCCISTLEHVGRDNRVYGAGTEHDDSGIPEALGELRRILAPGGRVLLTVPTGAEEDHGWFVQLPVAKWQSLFAHARLDIAEEETYELGPVGWSVSPDDAAGLRYGERGPAASAVYCVELRALEQAVVGAPAAGAGAEER
jgi:O-antigen chain-terminating methyltransferase